MLKLATLIDNPGEPMLETRLRDPKVLAAFGYNGLVLYETSALSGVASPQAVGSGEMSRWLERQFDLVGQRIEAATKAGLEVYLAYDMLCLPKLEVGNHAQDYTCSNREATLCPGSEKLLNVCVGALEKLIRRWPDVAGVVLRFGDNDVKRFPYLAGNDLYMPHCSRCSSLSAAERILNVVNRVHGLVVETLDKRLIVRAWNVRPGGMHDAPDLAGEVVAGLPGKADDDRLVLSFKFTETDFWRYQKWNQSSLQSQGRPVIYELQCQREFEGKGGIPNWQVPLWRDGYPESKTKPAGLASIGKSVNLAGLWAWVRGGGWGGPFVSNEAWIEANVSAVPRLADNQQVEAGELGRAWIADYLGDDDATLAAVIEEILTKSPEWVREAMYVEAYANRKPSPWHPNGDWIQDDLLDAQAALGMLQKLSDDQLQAAVEEKERVAEQVSQASGRLHQMVTEANRSRLEPLVHSLLYTESLFETLRDLVAGLVAYRRYRRSKSQEHASECQRRLLAAQSHWNHHTQRHATLPGAATAFRENNFWDVTQRLLEEVT